MHVYDYHYIHTRVNGRVNIEQHRWDSLVCQKIQESSHINQLVYFIRRKINVQKKLKATLAIIHTKKITIVNDITRNT